ncbi:UNKNOWN [Stylonychia lemnae]|uniref:CRAL-TRIO domain-containing protein n=1 Tax=Stylonychia lemnae TaxID=5949 RepID=A0A078ALR6_STYLE|nr:UNKNOWN [Stylonychia lemnae]|eukprot:CDW82821.1 UNKNOWN [Stylonychia lemnae]
MESQPILKPSEESLQKFFTDEAQNYQPKPEDIFITIKSGLQQRLIFSKPQVLTEKEEQELQGLRDLINSKGNQIPPGFDNDSRLVLRFLQGMKFNYEETEQALNDNYKWKTEIFPINPSPFENYLQTGLLYAFKRDKGHRPIIIINVERLIASKIDEKNLVDMSNYFLDFLINECMYPSKIENWTVIVDLNNVGLTQIPKNLLQSMISSMQSNYRGRMYRLFAINLHWLLRGLWSIAKNGVDQFTLTKMQLFGGDFKNSVVQVINENSLEEKYGGKLPDKTSNFFPPDLLNNY